MLQNRSVSTSPGRCRRISGSCRARLAEILEDAAKTFLAHADAGVAHLDDQAPRRLIALGHHLEAWITPCEVNFRGVLRQIEMLTELSAVGLDHAGSLTNLHHQPLMLFWR